MQRVRIDAPRSLVRHDARTLAYRHARTHARTHARRQARNLSRYCEKPSVARVKPRARPDAYGNGARLPLYGNGYESARGRSNHCDQLALLRPPVYLPACLLVCLPTRNVAVKKAASLTPCLGRVRRVHSQRGVRCPVERRVRKRNRLYSGSGRRDEIPGNVISSCLRSVCAIA